MPAEKLSTSISKPGFTLPCQRASRCFITQAANGPMIMAPRNIGWSGELMITPIVATTATTPPRTSYTIRPPWFAIRSGSM